MTPKPLSSDIINHHNNLAEEAGHSGWDHHHGPQHERLTLENFENWVPMITGGMESVFCQDETGYHNGDGNLVTPV